MRVSGKQRVHLAAAAEAQVADAWRAAITRTEGSQILADLRDASAEPAGKAFAWTLYTDGIEALVASWLSAARDSAGRDSAAGAHAADFHTALSALAFHGGEAPARPGNATIAQHVANGIPEALAMRIVDASNALYADEICVIAQSNNASIADAAQRYAAVGQTTGLIAVIGDAPPGESRWAPLARHILRLRYTALLRVLVLGVSGRGGIVTPETLTRIATILQRVVGANPGVAALVAAEHQIRAVL